MNRLNAYMRRYVPSTLCMSHVRCVRSMYVTYTLCNVRYLYIEKCTFNNVHCIKYIVQCTSHVRRTLYVVQCRSHVIVQCTSHVRRTLYVVQCTLHARCAIYFKCTFNNIHCTSYTIQCTSHVRRILYVKYTLNMVYLYFVTSKRHTFMK